MDHLKPQKRAGQAAVQRGQLEARSRSSKAKVWLDQEIRKELDAKLSEAGQERFL